MSQRVGKPGKALKRGIYVLPCMADEAEIVLFAVRADGRILGGIKGMVPVPFGSNSVQISEALWDRLELEDPDMRMKLRVI